MTANRPQFAPPSIIQSVLAGNESVLRQLQTSLSELSIDHYQWEFNSKSGSIGKHTRHILDHYRCFYDRIDENVVDYDARARDPLLETNPQRAYAAIALTLKLLKSTASTNPDTHLQVVTSTDADITAPMTTSTIARELVFLQSHTIHHMASIRMLSELQGISVRDSFGLSPATLKLEQSHG